MKAICGKIFGIMAVVAVIYCNYHAVRESTPFFKRQINRLRGTRLWTGPASLINRVRQSNIVQGTKTKVKNTGGRVVHMFKRREHDSNKDTQVA